MSRDPVDADRSFALLLCLIFLAAPAWGAWQSFRSGGGTSSAMLPAAFVIAVLGLLRPVSFRWARLLWMGLGRLAGRLVTPVVLTLLWILALTPIAAIRRLRGERPLDLRWKDGEDASAWVPRDRAPRSASSYRLQF